MTSTRPTRPLLAVAAAVGLALCGALLACSDAESPGPTMSTAGSGGQAPGGSAGSASGGGGSSNGGTTAGGGGAQAGGAAGSASGGAAGGGAGGGGAGGAAGAGGSGGQAPYNPCPTNGDPCRIMPLGDSITHFGGIEESAYRLPLFRLALMNDKKLVFVGSHENGVQMTDGVPFPRFHEGHSGWTIADGGGRDGLYDMIETWLANAQPGAMPPHIVTLMIGTNDVDIQVDLTNAPMRLGLLLDRIAMHAPNALTVVAQIVPTTDDATNVRVQAFNAAIPGLVKQRADAGKHIISVDMYGALTENPDYKTAYMADKLHPKQEGLEVMAQVWYDAIGPLLPAAQ